LIFQISSLNCVPPVTAAIAIAAGQLGMIGSAVAHSSKAKAASVPALKPGTNTSFVSLKQIDAGVLSVTYAEVGPANGPVVFFCMAGRMTFIAMSMLLLLWHRWATG
jgi:hypothetical protein